MINEETVALEGNGQRPSHLGDGWKLTKKMYTLNTTEVHGVAYEETDDGIRNWVLPQQRVEKL